MTQGKLFSKIGYVERERERGRGEFEGEGRPYFSHIPFECACRIETFPLSLDQLLSLWEAYLKKDLSLTNDATKIVEMVAIGIFSIHNADDKCGMHTLSVISLFLVIFLSLTNF